MTTRIQELEQENAELKRQLSILKQQSENPDLSALRQIKYEYFCANVDIFGFSVNINKDRKCTIESSYDTENKFKLEFVYNKFERRYTDLVWSTSVEKYMQLYQYWVVERECIPAFIANLTLDMYKNLGAPPKRQSNLPRRS